jgi:acyl carrier protein phosphodiesterase
LNFLAHIYLSGDSDEIKVGNFIGDYVKGRNYENYPELVRKGILLHRKIDSYTDSHPIVIQSQRHLKKRFRRYSGVIVDIFYDHFLASEWNTFSKHPLRQYVINMYEALVGHYFLLPDEIKTFLPFFIINNWLESYTSIEGIEGVLRRNLRNSIEIEGRRAVGEDVFMTRKFDDPRVIIIRPHFTTEAINFNIPQGIYDRLSFQLKFPA